VTGAASVSGLTLTVGATTTAIASTVAGADAGVAGNAGYGQNAGSAYAVAQAINAAGIDGVSASAATSSGDLTFNTLTGTQAGDNVTLTLNGVSIFGSGGYSLYNGTSAVPLSQAQVVQAINAQTGSTGVSAILDPTTGKVELQAVDGSTITASGSDTIGGTTTASAGVFTIGAGAGDLAATTYGKVTVNSNTDFSIAGGAASGLDGTYSPTGSLSGQDVLTQADANATILSVDSALSSISNLQSVLGAIQNRFTAAAGNLTSSAQNLTQARSTIQDANFASGNREPDPGPGAGTGGYLGSGAGQCRAAADPQAFELSADSMDKVM
jgi:flagellin